MSECQRADGQNKQDACGFAREGFLNKTKKNLPRDDANETKKSKKKVKTMTKKTMHKGTEEDDQRRKF